MQQLDIYQSFRMRSNQSLQRSQSKGQSPADPNLQRSFETTNSGDIDKIFTDEEDNALSSNNTSLLSVHDEGRESHFSGGTQLESALLDSFEGRQVLQKSNSTIRRPKELLAELPISGPFRAVSRQLPQNLPYWLIYEFYRVSHYLEIDVDFLHDKINKICDIQRLTSDSFWHAVKTVCKNERVSPLPPRSDLKEWMTRENSYMDTDSGKSVSLSGKLSFSKDLTKEIFDFKLNTINNDQSCRFHRKFGADRFLVLDVPYLDTASLPAKPREAFKGEEVHDSIFDWLTTTDLHIAGRTWRVFYVEPKDQTKKKRKEEGMRQKIHLFAVNGFDFAFARQRPIQIKEFLQWHLPIQFNRKSTDLKLFARIQLGLSKTTATLALEPSEFIHVADKIAQKPDGSEVDDGPIMTDGCASISYKFALAIWKKYGKETDLPSAFQGRIGGAKGLWLVDYNNNHPTVSQRGWWIEVSDSQLKIKPHPRERLDADEFQRTFEIVKTSHLCSPAHLNVQLITILENNEVSRSLLADAMRNEFAEYRESFNEAMVSIVALRVWLQMYHNSSRSVNGDMPWFGGMPDARAEELALMLESGFHPRQCEYMTKRLKDVIKTGLDTYVDKLRIEIPHSTNAFCVPDPLGVLKPGEVQLNFSQPWKHPVTGFSEVHFDDLSVLVARNPAHLQSDIQAVRFKYYPELRHRKDVMIFSTQGEFPLAGKLSGGDYDGDTVTAIWDPKLTAEFQNYDVPDLPSKSTCGLEPQNQLVKDIFPDLIPSARQFNKFLQKCCSFNGRTSKLGEVTALFERLVYTNPNNINTPEARKLAALAGYLVDSAKQGDSFETKTWNKIRSSIEARYKPPERTAYKDDDPRPRRNQDQCNNIIDHLKFDVAEKEKEEILARYNNTWALRPSHDEDLKALYSNEWDRASRLPGIERTALETLLRDLRSQVEELHKEWKSRCGRNEGSIRSDDFTKLVNELHQRVNAIEPRDTDCDVRHEFLRDGGGKGTRWSLLRASCLHYTLPPHHVMPWRIVGDELCRLKARQYRGRTREVIQEVRDFMKMDTKKQRRFADAEEDDVGSDDDAE